MFVRKRDPRYKAYIARQAKSTEQASSAPASGTATPRKPAQASTFVAQDWQTVAEPSDAAADLEWARAEGAEDEEWECVACNKTFRSEAAWNSHERSKKHLRAVEQLKREMQNEEVELDLGQGQCGDGFADVDVNKDQDADEDQGTAGADVTVHGSRDNDTPEGTPGRPNIPIPKEEGDSGEGEEFSPRPGRQQRTKKAAYTSSPSPAPPPSPVPKPPQKGRTRAARGSSRQYQQTGGDLVFSEENREATLTPPGESHHARNGGEIVREDDGAGTAGSTKGESLSKREKRRAREAAKKARESEAKSGCAVSFS
jgi:DnaJ family protein A protein 5